jgi:ATP-dependent protease ClpP protease subunit
MIKQMTLILGLAIASLSYATEVITLPEDTIIFRADFEDESVGDFIKQTSLAKGDTINVFIDSPGGSVFALDRMISHAGALRGTGKKIRCFIDFAASAAFAMVQTVCDERIVQPNSILMQHQATYGVKGPVNQIQEINGFLLRMLERIEKIEAKRIGMSLENFRRRLADDWYTQGQDAVDQKLADKVSYMSCPPKLFEKTVVKSMQIFIFKVRITESGCPLVPPVLELDMEGEAPKISGRERFEQYRSFYVGGGKQ